MPSSAQRRSGSTRSRRRRARRARSPPDARRSSSARGARTPIHVRGEAPGFHEDQQGVPFVGQAGKLLDRLLEGIGLTRADVYVVNVLKCRPPGNRDPLPEEIAACEPHLFRQIELMEPKLVATLGNFATKLLSGRPAGITRVHGQQQEVTLGSRKVSLYPLYHPAAALYTSMLKVLEEDFARIPELLDEAQDSQPARSRRLRSLSGARSARPVLTCGSRSPRPRRRRPRRLRTGRRAAPVWDVVTISGELGSGRRRSCAAPVARSAWARVTSPTFTIGHRYRGRIDVSHLDLFRFSGLSRRNGVISSRTSRSRGLRRVARGRPRGAARRPHGGRIEHAGGDRRTIELAAEEGALLEGIT